MPSPRFALLSPAVGTANVGDRFVEQAVRRLLPAGTRFRRFSIRRPLTAEEFDKINRSEAALLCGTNLYQRDWHAALTPRDLDRIDVPVIPVGLGGSAASLDDLTVGPETTAMIRALHRRCAVSGVRDPFSVDVLDAVGVSNHVLTGCPVLFWPGRPDPPRFERRPRRRVVITARNWLMHRWPESVDHPAQIAFLRSVLATLPPAGWVFAVHEPFDRSLIELLDIPRAAVVDSRRLDDYLRLYTDPNNVVLASRLHAGMLAVASGVPTLFVNHDTRAYSFCQMMGLDQIDLFAPDAAEVATERLARLADGDVGSMDPVGPAWRRLRSAMDGFLEANGLPNALERRPRSTVRAGAR